MTETAQPDVQFIYEPVRTLLAKVDDNLLNLASKANLGEEPELLAHAVVSGGKKVRPTITLLVGGIFGGPEETLVTMGTAVELLHIATLVHDDTVDKADTRRGRATISNIWGNDVAVLLGDYVFATSATFVCDTGNLRVVRRFSETIMELAQGELAEFFSVYDWDQSIDDYNKRIYDKTASLFCTASESGAVLSGASEAMCQALRDYGYNLGMAFQIMDDVLDFISTEEELGKPVGNDLLQGTVTLPVLLFAAKNADSPELKRVVNGNHERDALSALVEKVRASSAIAETLAVIDDYKRKAQDALMKVPAHRSRESLDALIDYVSLRRN